MEVPTMEIDVDGHPVVINVADFDPNTMKKWEVPAAPGFFSPAADPAPEPVVVTPPAHEPPDDPSDSTRRRTGRG